MHARTDGAMIALGPDKRLIMRSPSENFVTCPHPPAPAPKPLVKRFGRITR